VNSREAVNSQLELFAAEGLRILVLATRDLDAGTAKSWLRDWNEAQTATKNRKGRMEAAAAELEKDLTVVGCTAIEDRLQDDVPQTIADLATAGVKLWVLTGDKITTAIEIAKSCRLLTAGMEQLHVNLELGSVRVRPPSDSDTDVDVIASTSEDDGTEGIKSKVLGMLDDAAKYLESQEKETWKRCLDELKKESDDGIMAKLGLGDTPTLSSTKRVANVALIVDGPSLNCIMDDPVLLRKMLSVACCCKAVVACRVSPKQKQEIVKMVKEGLKVQPITLAIGDGANDVGMIQEAQIGIGISGKEGRQAVNNSDFAIAQFRFLKRLLLVHGRWNYRRMARTVVYFFNKNIVITALIFFFVTKSAFSGQSAFEEWLYTAYNAVFLFLQPFSLGIFDQDISAHAAMRHPQCYAVGREQRDLNVAVMVRASIRACIEGTILFWCVFTAGENEIWFENGNVAGLFVWGGALYNALLTNMIIKITILHKTINRMMFYALSLQVIGYLGYQLIAGGGIVTMSGYNYGDYFMVPQHAMSCTPYWLLGIMLGATTAVVDIVLEELRLWMFPTETDDITLQSVDVLCGCHRSHPTSDEKILELKYKNQGMSLSAARTKAKNDVAKNANIRSTVDREGL
jgi:phospholipid-translocating P-type ATPase (flippase)